MFMGIPEFMNVMIGTNAMMSRMILPIARDVIGTDANTPKYEYATRPCPSGFRYRTNAAQFLPTSYHRLHVNESGVRLDSFT